MLRLPNPNLTFLLYVPQRVSLRPLLITPSLFTFAIYLPGVLESKLEEVTSMFRSEIEH